MTYALTRIALLGACALLWSGPALAADARWQISTLHAENIHGNGPGNHAMWGGDPTLPACWAGDSLGGVAHSMHDDLVWSRPVADPDVATTVLISAWLNYDLFDETWDWLELLVVRGEQEQVLTAYTGAATDNVYLEESTRVEPGEYTGTAGDEVKLIFRVRSDGAWDDEDCFAPSHHGATQVDDISVRFDGTAITFDDFEPGSTPSWEPAVTPSAVDDTPAAGRLTVIAVPNPFNPATTIRYDLPVAGPFEIAVYDLKGRRVRRLLVGERPAGPGAVVWDGRDDGGAAVASGGYLYRATDGDAVRTGKVVLAK